MPRGIQKEKGDKPTNKHVSASQSPISGSEPQNRSEEKVRGEERESNPRNPDKPRTVNIGHVPQIDVKEGIEANSIARRANNIAVWSTIVGAFLFVITLGVFWQTYRQTGASIISANAAKKSADLQKQALDSQIAAKKQSDIADAKKLKRDTDFINKQKQGVNAQIASLQQAEDNFKIINRSYLQIGAVDTVKIARVNATVRCSIYNIGQQPAKITRAFCSLSIDTPGIKTFYEIKKVKENIYSPDNTYVVIGAPQNKIVVFPDQMPQINIDAVKTGKQSIYIYGEFVYVNLATKDKSIYKFAIEFNISNGKYYDVIRSDNIPVK